MKKNMSDSQQGFTLIELMMVTAIIGVLVAIAYPNYQKSVIKTKRTDMMTKMADIASNIESSKLAKGSYANVDVSDYLTTYPLVGQEFYTVTITPVTTVAGVNGLPGITSTAADWTITATPITTSIMNDDGNLTLNFQNIKCKNTTCGYAKEWND